MATITMPAMPAPVTFTKPSRAPYQQLQNQQNQPFDPRLLSRKLEAHRRSQIATNSSELWDGPRSPSYQFNEHSATKRASYMPQPHITPDDPKRATKSERTEASRPSRKVTATIAEGNPKQALMALQLGISQRDAHEHARNTALPSPPLSQDRRRSSLFIGIPRHPSSSPPSRSDSGTNISITTSRSDVSSASAPRGYRPGDAAKRNAAKRQSRMFLASDLAEVSAQAEAYRIAPGPVNKELNLQFGNPVQEQDNIPELPIATADGAVPEPSELKPERPLQAHDRPNWSQGSECGDEPPTLRRHTRLLEVPTLKSRRRKSTFETVGEDEMRRMLERKLETAAAEKDYGLPALHVGGSEKAKKRQSVFHFFRR